MKVIIRTSKGYGKYLKSHLQKEHPKTKGKIKIVQTRYRHHKGYNHPYGCKCKFCKEYDQ